MTAVWMRARAELRARWLAWVAMGLLLGLASAAAIAAAAGARRTESAYPRFLEAQRAMDVLVDVRREDGSTVPPAEVRALPGVEVAAPVVGMFGLRLESEGSKELLTFPEVYPIATPDGSFGTIVSRPKVLRGRLADPAKVDEITIGFSVAERRGIDVGDRFEAIMTAFVEGGTERILARAPVHVVGITALPTEFEPFAGASIPTALFTQAFFRQHAEVLAAEQTVNAIRFLRGDRDIAAFESAAQSQGFRAQVFFKQSTQSATVRRSLRFVAGSLWMLAGLSALAMAVVLGQALARQGLADSVEHPALRALGMSHMQLVGVGLVRAAVIAVTASAVAVVGAYLGSAATLTGLARVAEPEPGLRLDMPTFVVGVAAIIVLVGIVSTFAHWRAARLASRSDDPIARPSRLAALFAKAGAPATVASGVRMAFEAGRGRRAVPARSSLVGAVLGMVAVAAALTFSSSLDHLAKTPALAGWTFDVVALSQVPTVERARDELEKRGWVERIGVGGADFPTLSLNGRVTLDGAMALPLPFAPSIADGRAARTRDEITLGRDTMVALDLSIGDEVRVRALDPEGNPLLERPMRVVGRMIVPSLGFNLGSAGEGGAITSDGAKALGVRYQHNETAIIATLKRGVEVRRVHDFLQNEMGMFVVARRGTIAASDAARVSDTPLIYALIVLLMAFATLAHALVSAMRRRRRDLAILKTLGFVKAQVRATVAWQASALVVVALAVGIPLGVVAGRAGWRLFADALGVVPVPVVPLLAVLLAVPVLLVLGNVVAAFPARAAARTQPALVLRSE